MQQFISPLGAPSFPRIRDADGIYLFGVDGQRYIDGSSGAVCCTLGHRNARVMAAMQEQAARVSFAYARYWDSDANDKLLTLLAARSGFGLDAAFFVSGGSEAVEASLKFARQLAVARGQEQRWKIFSVAPSYHGSTMGALSVTGDPVFGGMFTPYLTPHPKIPAPLTYRLPDGHDGESYARACADQLEQRIAAEGPETCLGIIFEPVGGTATGASVAHDVWFARLREICDRHGLLLIFDEVMSCAGRAGRFLAAQYWPGCAPDIVAVAKGISGGYAPFGALLTRAALADELRGMGGFAHGHTYAANPQSCAAAAAVIEELNERRLVENSERQGATLRGAIRVLAEKIPIIGDVRGRGLHNAIELVADQSSKRMIALEHNVMDVLKQECHARGLVLLSRRTGGGRFGEWAMLCPPLIIDETQLGEMIAALEGGLRATTERMQRAGAL
jgi:adenosylmethionine-8-amino-7-oxononanoate aminotransferase